MSVSPLTVPLKEPATPHCDVRRMPVTVVPFCEKVADAAELVHLAGSYAVYEPDHAPATFAAEVVTVVVVGEVTPLESPQADAKARPTTRAEAEAKTAGIERVRRRVGDMSAPFANRTGTKIYTRHRERLERASRTTSAIASETSRGASRCIA
jgi:hypothetical protein